MDLRREKTQAVRSVREESEGGMAEPIVRQVLNLQQLTQIILHGHIQYEEMRPVKSGKKRLAPVTHGSRKRMKEGTPLENSNSGIVFSSETERKLLVYVHKFELSYATTWKNGEDGVEAFNHRYANDGRASDLGWLQEEQLLTDTLNSQETHSPRIFEIGDVTLENHWGVTQLYVGCRPQLDDDEHYYLRYLATLPNCTFPKYLQDDRPGNILETCFSLQRTGHLSMSASASLLYIPGIVTPDLPIQLHVTVQVSLTVPAIFFPRAFHVPLLHSVEGQRRRFLSYLFCYDPTHSNSCQPQVIEGPSKSLRQFYSILEAAPPISSPIVLDALQPPGLRATLLPFQRRTIKWLLEREGKSINSRGQLVPFVNGPHTLPLFWRRVETPMNSTNASENRSPWYYNCLTGAVTETSPKADDVSGAMLCEEMGLGKTLECIALMLINPATDRSPTATRWDVETELNVSPIKTNLIVTPSTLSQQWLDELTRHAPGLKVLSFVGYNKVKFPRGLKVEDQEDVEQSKTHRLWCSYLQEYDVVVTTYNILSQELGVARAPIVRPKRKVASYSHVEKPRSPLVRVEWARVFMDEVQLVGGGKTAEMVSLIPRKVSIAVSGTPAKSKVSDLTHVLKFLRINEAIGSTKTWDCLLKPEFNDLFSELFRKYAIRTLKAKVKEELTIPAQKRFAIGIDLGKAERHIYDLTLQEALDELGVDGRGVAEDEGWQLDVALLRGWLRRLRQVCTHPQVAIFRSSKAATKSINSKTIKTIEEVLQGYQEQNWNSLITENKNKIQHRVRRAQLVQEAEDDSNRYQHARDLLLSAQPEVEQLLSDVRTAISAHEEKGKEIVREAAARRHERRNLANTDDAQVIRSKGKGKEQIIDSSDDEEDDGLPKTQLGDEYRARQRNLQGRLREIFVLQHKVTFLLGDVYHMLGIPSQEESSYANAEVVRRTVLKSSEDSAISAMARLLPQGGTVQARDFQLKLCQKGGIRSAHLMEEANDILGLLAELGELMWKWRTHLLTLLTQKLSSPEEEKPDGEEYARTLDTQGEAEVYLEAYAALVADLKEVLIAERTVLTAHDARETQFRSTMASKRADNPMRMDDEVEPENEVLQQELADRRKEVRAGHSKRALKAIMHQISEIGNRTGDRVEETHIAKEEGKRLRKIITDLGTVIEKFELELTSFRRAFNERVLYFRQLQELSDSVVQPEYEGDVRVAIESSKAEEEKATLQANVKRAGQRHFNSLAKDRAEGELREEDCVLCGDAFQRGLMTPCGHIYCEPCLTRWLKHRGKRSHLDCPMCRSNVEIDALQRISLTDVEFIKQLDKRGAPVPLPGHSVKFKTLPRSSLDLIETFEAHGSYGSKITFLIRHLLYLRDQDPGSKSVVFSAWSDSLTIIQRALADNGIRSIRVDQKGKHDAAQMFKSDPGLSVFLLHGERENAGLNLTCAKRVWLIEPTVNHAFEVQAISRVDRMGQTSATEVFCYYIQDTVEENILRMGARRGLSLYTEDHSRDAIDISELAMGEDQKVPDGSPKKKMQKGDFIAQEEDLIHVLFPHLDLKEEDLVDLKDVPRSSHINGGECENIILPRTGGGQANAIAGPSRLRQ